MDLDPALERALRATRATLDVMSDDRLDASYANFRERFGPDKLLSVSGEALLDLMHGRGTKESLVYWLEFKSDEDFRSDQLGSISGGSAHKFGIFHKAKTHWVKGTPQAEIQISPEEAIEIARKQCIELRKAATLIEQLAPNASDPEYATLQETLRQSAPEIFNRAWAHKYLSLLFPEKLDDFHNEDYQRHNLIKCLQIPPEHEGLYPCAARFVDLARRLGWRMNHLTTVLNERNGPPHRYWRIGSRIGENKDSIWLDMRDGRYVAVGWPALGDLSKQKNGNGLKDGIRKSLETHYPNDPGVLTRKAAELFNFVQGMEVRDLVLVADGQTILGIGRVTGDYRYDSTEPAGAPHRRSVDWLQLDEWSLPVPSEGVRTTIMSIKKVPKNLIEIERRLLNTDGTRTLAHMSDIVDHKRRFWIEKTIVRGRIDRLEGPHRLGAALWSPQRSKDGRDVYANMRVIEPDDVVFHLTDNEAITGVSLVAAKADDSFQGVQDTAWGLQPSLRVSLRDFAKLDPPLHRDAIFGQEVAKRRLAELLQSADGEGLFYNKNMDLNQGGYLTPAPAQLLAILNDTYQDVAGKTLPYLAESQLQTHLISKATADPEPSYTINQATEDLFMDVADVHRALKVWHSKKNMILQGPPGVGKTFAAERLAFALMEAKAPKRLGFTQFHQSYSYEDFVQGYRPNVDGGFALRQGRFLDFCDTARMRPNDPHVFVIDEINRGNLSKILGELMMLIESDKRSEEWALPLAYSHSAQTFFVPPNVFILGLMNTADRSLAVVDYALRRRFAFVELQPQFGSRKFSTHLSANGLSEGMIALIRQKLSDLNSEITRDQTNLGKGFAIGHSFFCGKIAPGLSEREWYSEIIETEILPLLTEYWFDSPEKVRAWRNRLLSQD